MLNVSINQTQDNSVKMTVTYVTSCYGTQISRVRMHTHTGILLSTYRHIDKHLHTKLHVAKRAQRKIRSMTTCRPEWYDSMLVAIKQRYQPGLLMGEGD